MNATGKDDPDLAETTWPIPEVDLDLDSVEWRLRYGDPVAVRFDAAAIVSAYNALLRGGTTRSQIKYLAALRRVYRRRIGR